MWITNDRNNRKFNFVVKSWKFYLDARGRSFNDAMNVIDKNYLSEYTYKVFIASRSKWRKVIFESILRV